MRQLVIDRSKWRCGENTQYDKEHFLKPIVSAHGIGKTKLLNKEGFKCCLGFAANQLDGCSDEVIADKILPNRVTSIEPCSITNRLGSTAAKLNDNGLLSFEEREARIAALFAKYDVDVTFIGEYTDVKP